MQEKRLSFFIKPVSVIWSSYQVVDNWQKYATAAESAHCGTVAYRTTISTNLYGRVGEIK